MKLSAAREWARTTFVDNQIEAIDADYLLCAVLHKPRSFLFAFSDHNLSDTQIKAFQDYVTRRRNGEPVAYILGEKEFWSLPLKVSSATLIPRPETELLVETALNLLPQDTATVCDLGTGTGAIALALASERKHWHITAVDRVAEAVELAQENARALHLDWVEFMQSDWFTALKGKKFDAIISNPPYVEESSKWLQQGDVRFEPRSALTAGADGLDDIKLIILAARDHLHADGWIMLEHGYKQHKAVAKLLKDAEFVDIRPVEDLNQYQRITLAKWQ